MMNSHRMRSTILSLVNDAGVNLEDAGAIKNEIVGYYKGLLGSKFNLKRDAKSSLDMVIRTKVPDDLKESLIRPVSRD